MNRSYAIKTGMSQNCKFIVLNHGKPMRGKRKQYKRSSLRRHTYSTIAGIEDLTAVLVDLSFRVERIIAFSKTITKEVDEITERLDMAKEIAQAIRVSPHNYPIEGKYQITRTQVKHETQGERTRTRSTLQASQD